MTDMMMADSTGLVDVPDFEADQRTPETAPPSCDDDDDSTIDDASDLQVWPYDDFSVVWPRDRLPVEIFEIITTHLTRFEVRSLRLVCREFEAKVSAQYFRNVVVPFKSELYSTLGHDRNGILNRTSSALLSNGMRIFESFGPHIWRFALSLELDEDALAYPPIKPTQEAVPAFWGLYRWPHTTYHRYSDLEGLEQTADETGAMKDALKCLSKVRNLGLCCDAGLGFLSGPDHIARNATTLHPVFATQNWRRAGSEPDQRKRPIVNVGEVTDLVKAMKKPVFENPISFKKTVLQKMVTDAGFEGTQINEAVRMILETEDSNLAAIDFDERASMLNNFEGRRPFSPNRLLADFEPSSDTTKYPLIPSSLTTAQKEMLLELEWAHRAMIQSYVIGLIDNARDGCFQNLTTLTIAKIPSSHVYIFNRHDLWQNLPTLNNVSLGVIADWRRVSKPAPGCVEDKPVSPVEAVEKVYQLLNTYIGAQQNVESLHFEWICGGEFAPGTYQRNHYILPAPFLPMTYLMSATDSPKTHGDSFLSLPFVKHLSLKNCWSSPHVLLHMIRFMALSSLEKLELESVSLSGPPTNQTQAPLLQGGMGPNPNAANLLNLFQQVHHVPADQAGLPHQQPQLQLQLQPQNPLQPALGNFGLGTQPDGNWAANMIQNVQPPVQPQQQDEHQQDDQQDAQQIPPLNLLSQLNTLAPDAMPGPMETLHQPEWLSWAGIIEHFSPGIKIRNILAEQTGSTGAPPDDSWFDELIQLDQYLPWINALEVDEKLYSLKCLSFKSCGYVSVDAPFLNTRGILPHGAQGLGGNANPHNQDLTALMQRCRDKMLGRVSPYISSRELFQLINAFGMDIGWENVYDSKTISDAVADGVESPGRGRFSGTIDADYADRDAAGYLGNLSNMEGLGSFS
ncbi:F-box domain-containing protein [Fusarium sp. LHS14.1]|nr:F-box domain-containing protein [Fusarium sp. LHS14.1]